MRGKPFKAAASLAVGLTPPPPPTPAADTVQVHVLIADADDASRGAREQQLRLTGARVSGARTAFEAIVKASCHLPDVILLDGALVDMGATEAGHLITTCPATSHIPVVRIGPGRPLPRRVLDFLRRAAL